MLFGRLWQRLGVDAVLDEGLDGRQFGVAVGSAVFAATLYWRFVSGSDRACLDWIESYAIDGSQDLALHHFYRAIPMLLRRHDHHRDRRPLVPARSYAL